MPKPSNAIGVANPTPADETVPTIGRFADMPEKSVNQAGDLLEGSRDAVPW